MGMGISAADQMAIAIERLENDVTKLKAEVNALQLASKPVELELEPEKEACDPRDTGTYRRLRMP